MMDEDAIEEGMPTGATSHPFDPQFNDVVPITNFESSNPHSDEAIDVSGGTPPKDEQVLAPDMEYLSGGAVRTLDGDVAGDEFAQDAMNYQILLGKIDRLLDRLRLDA